MDEWMTVKSFSHMVHRRPGQRPLMAHPGHLRTACYSSAREGKADVPNPGKNAHRPLTEVPFLAPSRPAPFGIGRCWLSRITWALRYTLLDHDPGLLLGTPYMGAGLHP